MIAAEKLCLSCHLTSRTCSGVSYTGTKHILYVGTYNRDTTLFQHITVSIPYIFVSIWVEITYRISTQLYDSHQLGGYGLTQLHRLDTLEA